MVISFVGILVMVRVVRVRVMVVMMYIVGCRRWCMCLVMKFMVDLLCLCSW